MPISSTLIAPILAVCGALGFSTDHPGLTPAAEAFKRAERSHWPTRDELGWQRIPWVAVFKNGKLDEIASVREALRQAREEKRPILIWSPDGDPFDQC